MTDVEVESEFRHPVHQITNLPHGIVSAGQVFDHQSDAKFAREWKQGADGFQVLFDNERSIMKRRLAVWMDIHPFCAECRKGFEANFEFVNDCSADRLEGVTKRQVIGGVADYGKLMVFQRGSNGLEIKIADRGEWRLQSQIDKVEAGIGHPRDFG